MPPEAAYKQDIKLWQQTARKSNSTVSVDFEAGHIRPSPENPQPRAHINQTNILDRIHFDIVKPHIQSTVQMVRERLGEHSSVTDPELYEPYQRELRSDDIDVTEELHALKKSLEDIYKLWVDAFRHRPEDNEGAPMDLDHFNKTLEMCHGKFKALQPHNTNSPTIRNWLNRIGSSSTWWSLVKASALALNHSTKYRFVFCIAGDLLGYLKAQYSPRHRILIEDIWTTMKPRKVRTKFSGDEIKNTITLETNDGFIDGEEEEDFDDFHSSFEYVGQ
jgi:hypothetical protein